MNYYGYPQRPTAPLQWQIPNHYGYPQGNADRRVAGYISRIDMVNFPTFGSKKCTIKISPAGEKAAVINGTPEQTQLILLAIQATLGAPIDQLFHQNRRLVDCLPRNPKQAAVINIHFWNEGPKAFEAARFGHRIIVQSLLHVTNTGIDKELNIGTHDFRVAERGEARLSRILEHYRIRIDYPLSWVAATSMHSVLEAKPKELYSLFARIRDATLRTSEMKSLMMQRDAKYTELLNIQNKEKERRVRQSNWKKLQFFLACYNQEKRECDSKRKVSCDQSSLPCLKLQSFPLIKN